MTTQKQQYGPEIYRLRAIEGLPWAEIYPQFPVPDDSQRRIYSQMKQEREERIEQEERPDIEGVFAYEEPDEDEVYERACRQWRKTAEIIKRKASQTLTFQRSPVCLVFTGDHHFGSNGVDYPRVFAEAELVCDLPNTWMITTGDMLDQMIIGQLIQTRKKNVLSIPDEWVLVRRYLRVIAHRLVLSVGGNHDFWADRLIGIDYFRDVLGAIAPRVLYDPDDCRVHVHVGDATFVIDIRHKWKGHSQWNDLHAIQKAGKMERDFSIGVGGHTHAAGLVAEFKAGGETKLSGLVGSYKRSDVYARQLGLPKPNEATAIAFVLHDDGSMWGTSNLSAVAEYMRAVYSVVY